MSFSRYRFNYNEHPPRREDEDYERPKTSHVSPATKRALEELELVNTWREFAEICERQKKKRGY